MIRKKISVFIFIFIILSSSAFAIDVSGVIYQSDETTPLTGSAQTVNVKVNGAGAYTDESDSGTGAWAITTVTASAGDTITVYLDGETDNANTVTITDGATNITDLHLMSSHLIIRNDNGATAITIVDMTDYDDDQESDDLLFDATDAAPDTLAIESNTTIYIPTGKTFTPGGNITNSRGTNVSLTCNGTWNATGSEILYLAGDMDLTNCIFNNSGADTVTFQDSTTSSGDTMS